LAIALVRKEILARLSTTKESCTATNSLAPHHRAMLEQGAGISPEKIRDRGYFTVPDTDDLRELGFADYQLRVPAMVIPVYGVDGKFRFYRVHPDDPRDDPERPGKVVQYEQPQGTGVTIDVPRSAQPFLSDAGTRLWIVEGEKEADALASHGECAVALLGAWSWKRDGQPLPEWDSIRLVGREVYVAFDAAHKVEVQRALRALAEYLQARGAVVRVVRLPEKADGSKQSVDDILAAGKTMEGLLELSEEHAQLGVFQPDWPVMPEEAFHGLAGSIVRTIEPNTESDSAGLLLLVLSGLGNAFGRGAHFEVENDVHYCKINVVLVGESSKARKGTAQGRVNRLISGVDTIWATTCCVTGLSTGEGLIHSVRDPVVKENKDGKIEVVDEGVSDKRLLVEEPEFASPLTVMQRDGNTLSMVLRSAWDDRTLQTLTKTSGEKSTGSHITVVAHVTKKELLKHLTEQKLGSGIANRFVFALVRRSKKLPHGGAEDAFDPKQIQSLERALEFGKTPRRIDFSNEIEESYGYSTKELWEEIYAELSEGKPGLFGAVVSRAEAQVRRIATIYAALDLSAVVRVDHLLAALAVWQYAEQSAYLIFGDRTGDMVADEILEALRGAAEEGMPRTEIHDLFGRHLKGRVLGTILRDLEAQGRISRKKVPKGEGPGRPPEVWCIRHE
jgi:Domain of unknown function (DUF3854)